MAQIALFHSVLGVRRGITDAANRLRGHGHEVVIVDQYNGRAFDDYGEAGQYVAKIGFSALMEAAVEGVAALDDGFLCMGFSNGGGMAEYVALHRQVGGVILCSGTLPLNMLGASSWPQGVPAQIHYMVNDPFRQEGWAESVAAAVRDAPAQVEFYEYPGTAHLFTDASLPAEFNEEASGALWSRVVDFCNRPGASTIDSD